MKGALEPIVTILILIMLTIGCNHSDNNVHKLVKVDPSNSLRKYSQSILESTVGKGKDINKIYDIVGTLPEVVERAKYIEKESNGNRHLQIMVYKTQKELERPYYWVKAGEDNGTNFVTHFNFYVYPRNEIKFEIKYFDTVHDTILNLESWRKQKNNGI